MKKLFNLVAIATLLFGGQLSAQLTADAGPDIVACVGLNGVFDSTFIGGSPSAIGGVPPYTYTWEACYVYQGQFLTFTHFASDFLNDTTLPNPTVENHYGQNIRFYLTVTDAMGATSTDSMRVRFSAFFFNLGYYGYTLTEGDSVFLWGGQNIGGGLPPQQYLWRPNHGLTDSTSLAFWAKPTHSVGYYLTISDSAGCKVTGSPSYYVTVLPLSVEQPVTMTKLIEVTPNPASGFVVVKIAPELHGEFTFRLFDADGRQAIETRFAGNQATISTASCSHGLYTYTVQKVDGLVGTGKIVINE
ncbi:MAG: T9SS type A sorting domain-containing protein [Bacteroidales bacterium]|nr:T9SS type A sorting domain-containing protein [Bacteroidales bacterium]MDD3666114.1 T9SS type A sorting domain-containing protein [Bacteroidales bacterium]